MIEIIATFMVSIVLSAFIGFLIYRYSKRRSRGRVFEIVAGGLAFGLILIASLPTLWFVGWRLPSTDMIEFARPTDLTVRFIDGTPDGASVTLAFQRETPDYEDFSVSISLVDQDAIDFTARILKPSEQVVSLRTGQGCPPSSAATDVFSEACSATGNGQSFGLRWIATPHRAAVVEFVVSSEQLQLQHYGQNASAFVTAGGRDVCEWRNPDGSLWRSGSNRSGISCVPVQLDQNRVALEVSNADTIVDLARGEFRFLVEILTTLGVSRGTYGWLALLGALVSGFLGSGWLWKVLDSRRGGNERASG